MINIFDEVIFDEVNDSHIEHNFLKKTIFFQFNFAVSKLASITMFYFDSLVVHFEHSDKKNLP